MAIVKSKAAGNSGYRDLFEKMGSVVNDTVNVLPNKQQAGAVAVAVESFSDYGIDRETFQQSFDTTYGNVQRVATESAFALASEADAQGGAAYGFAVPHIREAQKRVATEAAAVLLQAHNNVGSYYSNIGKVGQSFTGDDVIRHEQITSGPAGTLPVVPSRALPTMESFDEKVTDEWREHSYSIAMTAAKQHEFNELFYKTQILTPDNAGFIMTVRRNVVWDGWKAPDQSGDAGDFHKRNILEGLLNHEILETDTTDLIPCLQTGKNDKYFIDSALVAPTTVEQSGEEFQTNYLAFNAGNFSLINLAQTPSRMQKGTPNHTDSLDSRIALSELIVKVSKDGATAEAIDFDVNRSNYAQYLATREMNFRQTTVKFHNDSLPITPETKLHSKAASAILKPLQDAGYTIFLSIKVDGEMNVESGNGDTRAPELKIVRALNAAGVEVSLNDATLAPLIAGIKFEPAGYSLEARLTNINQLERGLLIDSDVMKHGFMIPTLSPLCIMKPALTDDEKVYPRMEALQNAYRLQLRNAGVTTLLNRADTLERYLGNDVAHPLESQPGLEGLGQYYVRPYFRRIELDVQAELNSTNSAGRVEDIQGLFVSVIQEAIYRADLKTGYSAALETAFPGSNPKPHVAIGTDKRLPNYLMIQGDDRTTGIGFDFTVASISDLRMKDKVIMTFTLPRETEIHPLDHGILGMIPEYIVNFAMIREQRIANEIRLTPRYRHFHFLPLMIVIDVKNLEAAIAERTTYSTVAKVSGDITTTDATPAP